MIGHIIDVAAAFEIQIEMNVVVTINPKWSLEYYKQVHKSIDINFAIVAIPSGTAAHDLNDFESQALMKVTMLNG